MWRGNAVANRRAIGSDCRITAAGFCGRSDGFALKIIGGLGVLIISAGGFAEAQAAPTERGISISPTVRLTYDSNVLRGRETIGSGDVSGSDDVRLSPSLAVGLLYPFGRQSAFLTGSIGYDFYRKNHQLNRERISLDGGVNVKGPASCASVLGIGYSRRQSDLEDLILAADGATLINVVNAQETRRYSGNISCGPAIGLRPGLGYVRSETRNSGARIFQDIISDTYTGSLGYARPSFGQLSLYASYRNGRYPNRSLQPGVVTAIDGIKVYSGGLSYDREIGSRLGGSVSIGYTEVHPDGPQVAKFHGLSYSAAIRYQPMDRLSTSLSASRSAEQSNLQTIGYSISTAYSLSGTYRINERISAPFGVRYSTRSFRGSEILPGALVRDRDHTFNSNLGLRFQARQRLSLGLDAAYSKRTSGSQLLGYDNKQLSATVGLDF